MALEPWRVYQQDTANAFKQAGYIADVEKRVNGVRSHHDIDVYVTFQNMGTTRSWAVECKCWNTNVTKEKVAALKTIIDDIGSDRGFIISKSGFQAGAIMMAKNTNITLTDLPSLKRAILDANIEALPYRERVIFDYLKRFKSGHTRRSIKHGVDFERGFDRDLCNLVEKGLIKHGLDSDDGLDIWQLNFDLWRQV